MPLSPANVGRSTDFIEHEVDARWIMAYAASLGDLNPRYMDTATATVCTHPVFPVCLEWPSVLATRTLLGTQLTNDESARGVHAAHDLHIFRPIQAGAKLRTSATLISVEAIKPGAGYTLRLDTVDAANELICQTFQYGIYRGVSVEGSAKSSEAAPAPPVSARLNDSTTIISVPAGSAHTYTECARIWNPIHTDRKFAQDAGLPDIILHGTATLALSISELINIFTEGQPDRVVRLGGRFAAIVLMPSNLQLRTSGCYRNTDGLTTVSYAISTAQGEPAISGGFFVFR